MVTLDHLRAFVAVAEELHFGRAAERLSMTQPPLSRQIQRLEQLVGSRLFERTNRAVRLTAAGSALLGEARRVIGLADGVPELVHRAAAGLSGVLRIGFTATAALGVLGRLLRELDEFAPGIEVELHEGVSSSQIAMLDQGELDLALLREPPDPRVFAHREVHREQLMVAIPADDPLARRLDAVSPGDLAGRAVIGYSPAKAGYFDDLVRAVLAGVPTQPIQRVEQVHSMLALVAAGRGAAFVPQSATLLHPEGVVFRGIAGWTEPVARLEAVWRRDSTNPVLLRALRHLPVLAAVGRSAPRGDAGDSDA